MHRLIRSLVATLALAAGLAGAAGAPAQAAGPGNVYVSMPKWLGACPDGAPVIGIYGTNGALWTTPPAGDWGDDLVYPRVHLGLDNPLSFQPMCDRPWYKGGPQRGVPFPVTIRPTRSGQTFWVGPLGQSHN